MAITLNGTTGITAPKLDALDIELNSINVVERGSNANGDYVRLADGTQICHVSGDITLAINVAYGSLFQNTHTWTFPATFSSTPSITSAIKWGSSASWASIGGTPSGSSATMRAIDTVSRDTSQAAYRSYTAIGRWY